MGFAAFAKAHGYGWLLVQQGRDRTPEFRAACHAAGQLFGIWDATPDADRAAVAITMGPDFYVAQAEQDSAGPLAALQHARGLAPDLPLGIVTNLSPSRTDPTFDAAMHALGVAALVECYLPDNPNATVANMVAEAKQRGYEHIVPVLGCYSGPQGKKAITDYPLGTLPGWCIWTAETMTASDWQA